MLANSILIFSQFIPVIDTIEFHSDIYRSNSYGESSIVIIDNRMFVDSKNALEEYSIDEEGNLELLSYELHDHDHARIAMKKQENYIYQVHRHNDYHLSYRSVVRALEVTDNGFEEIRRLEMVHPYFNGISDYAVNQDYLIYLITESGGYANVIDRETFEPVTDSLITGGRFAVRDSLLFVQMVNYPDSTYVSIQDISDIANPVELSRVYSNDVEFNRYAFHDNLLFITKNTKILIVDITDPLNPVTLSVLDDIPGLIYPEWNFFCNVIVYNQYMVIMSFFSTLFVYDFSNPESPVFLNSFPGPSPLNRIGALLEHNDYIYFGRFRTGISKIDAALLPEIIIIGDCLVNNRIVGRFLCSPYYIINESGNLWYFNIHNDSEIFHISNDLFHTYRSVVANDSLLFWAAIDYESTGQESYIRIYEHGDDGISFITEHLIEGITLNSNLYLKNPYLIVEKHSPHYYGVYSIDEQYDLIEEGIIKLPGSSLSWVLNYNGIFPEEYLYIYCLTTKNILIYDYQYPFDLIQQISILQYGDYSMALMYDQDSFVFYYDPNSANEYYIDTGIYSHSFPDQFIEIDRLQIADRYFQFFTNLNIFHTTIYRYRPREFYYFDHSGITYLGEYNFSHNDAWWIDFIPELSKLYVVDVHGRLLQRYDLDYTPVSVDEEFIETPPLTSLFQNYPNPFNPETKIEFYLEKGGEVKLEIFNIRGQRLATLIDEDLPQGEHSHVWNPKTMAGKDLPSGVYLYRLQTGDYDRTRKMLYLK